MIEKILIGAREKVELPTLGIKLTAKVDTGAYTSSLSASQIKEFELNGEKSVSFRTKNQIFVLPLAVKKRVKSSNGVAEFRPVIKSVLIIGNNQWEIFLTLTDRKSMKYPMLLGRQALINRCIIDISYSHLTSKIKHLKIKN